MEMRYHKSILLKEIVDLLKVENESFYIDCTLGDGGHSLEILKRGGKVIGIDQDPEAIVRSRERFVEEGIDESRFNLIRGNFSKLEELTKNLLLIDEEGVKGILFDLGVSSLQFDKGSRGFSFSKEADLDMRMDPDLTVKAMDLVNGLNKGELEKLLALYGEVRDRRIVNEIVKVRQGGMIVTTTELARIIERVVGRKNNGIHPATQVFQALRIAVNDELNSLRQALPQAFNLLLGGGVMLVISFHSLEDRIVKELFKKWRDEGKGEIMESVIRPNDEELILNPRSRSSKLRVFKKYV